MFYKNLDGKYLAYLSTGSGQIQIPEDEYRQILSRIQSAPSAPSGWVYLLRADTLDWELAELPPVPEPADEEDVDDAEALSILLGGAE